MQPTALVSQKPNKIEIGEKKILKVDDKRRENKESKRVSSFVEITSRW